MMNAEMKDGQKYDDPKERLEEMKRVGKDFSRAHAMAIHLNAIAIAMTVWYGFSLASRMTIA